MKTPFSAPIAAIPSAVLLGLVTAPLRDLHGLVEARISQLEEQGEVVEPAAEAAVETTEEPPTEEQPAPDEAPADSDEGLSTAEPIEASAPDDSAPAEASAPDTTDEADQAEEKEEE